MTQNLSSELFDYDPAPPFDAVERSLGERDGLHWMHITFRGGDGRVVPAIYVASSTVHGPAPAILLQHGAGTSKYARFVLACIQALAQNGYACMATDAIGHGEREDAVSPDDEAEWRRVRANPEFTLRNVIDFRRALDYLSSRPDVDANRLAYAGSSMGAMLGAVFCAVDPRPSVVILRCAGARADITETAQLNHVRYVGAIAPRPVLMLNNTEDEVFRRESVLRLYDAVGEPKELRWFPGDHRANHDLHAAECLEWLDRWLPRDTSNELSSLGSTRNPKRSAASPPHAGERAPYGE